MAPCYGEAQNKTLLFSALCSIAHSTPFISFTLARAHNHVVCALHWYHDRKTKRSIDTCVHVRVYKCTSLQIANINGVGALYELVRFGIRITSHSDA